SNYAFACGATRSVRFPASREVVVGSGVRKPMRRGRGKRRRLFIEKLERRYLLISTGLTIITHGYQAPLTSPGWITDMGNEIVTKTGGELIAATYQGNISQQTLYPAGQTVVTYDWTSHAHDTDILGLSATPGWREAAGDYLAAYLLGTGLVQ